MKVATPNFDKINPQVCINAKIRKLHRIINSAYQQKINPFGLKGSMLSIMFIIGKMQRINQKKIADMLVLDQSTMSRDLKKLVDKGWVKLLKGEDSRNIEAELTNKGYLLLEEVVPVWEKLHKNVETILGSYNIQQIDHITMALKENVKKLM